MPDSRGQVKKFPDYTLDHQGDDGWLGPEKTRQTRGIWARSLLCFGLVVRRDISAPLIKGGGRKQSQRPTSFSKQYAEADPTETES